MFGVCTASEHGFPDGPCRYEKHMLNPFSILNTNAHNMFFDPLTEEITRVTCQQQILSLGQGQEWLKIDSREII